MARLNSKDSELTLTGKSINLSDSKNAYIGGEFLTNPRDYIEVLIYDTNNNFLESAIVNEEDYLKVITNGELLSICVIYHGFARFITVAEINMSR